MMKGTKPFSLNDHPTRNQFSQKIFYFEFDFTDNGAGNNTSVTDVVSTKI